MSVWPTSVTRLGTARAVYESSKGLFAKAYGGAVYPHLDPDEESTGWTRETTWMEVASDLDWKEPDEADGPLLVADLEKVERVKLGAEAYFELIAGVHNRTIKTKAACNHRKLEEVAKHMVTLLAPSTQVTPAKFIEACSAADNSVLEKGRVYYDAADEFKLLRRSKAWADQDEEYVDATNNRVSDASAYVYRKVGLVHVFLGKGQYKNKALVLADKGFDMVIGALERISALHEFIGRAWADSAANTALALKLLDFQITRAASVRGSAADKVSKAWHEVRTYAQYKVLNSIMDDAIVALAADYVSDKYADVVPLDEAMGMVQGPDHATTLELVHVYKWAPPPEYDVTQCLQKIRDLHRVPRVSGANPKASDVKRETYELITAERKMNLLTALKRMRGDYPVNLIKKGDAPTIDEAAAWDETGALRYEHMGKHVSGAIKDKSTVKPRMADEVASTGRDLDQNFLTWFLLNWDEIDTREELSAFAAGDRKEEGYSRAAYKGESHKEFSRPFFIAPPIRRLLLGEFEGNLSKVARFYPAALIGKSDAASGAMMDSAMDPYAHNSSVPAAVVTTTYIVMFDVSKWSPKSDGAQVQEYHDFWARVYGDARLAALKTIGCDDKILSTTDGLKFSYQNCGADLEGYRGRMGTMYHADMLGAVCRKAIKEGYIAGRSELVVFIDDGAVKLEVIGVGEEAKANARNFLEVLKEIYAAGGQEVHNRKVVISEIGGEILANFYMHGVKVPQGIKAAMKITPDYTNPVASLVEANDNTYASCQGALKAGAPLFSTYMIYVIAILRNYGRFHRKGLDMMNHTTMAIMAYAPKSFGGLGTQGLQGLVTTCVTNLTAEGVSILNRMARFYPDVRPAVKKIITYPVLKRESLSVLRDPLRLALAGPSLVESRIVRYVVKHLIDKEPLLARLVTGQSAESLIAHATAVADNLLSGGSISIPLLVRAWSATPLAQVETIIGKFERSDSIISFLGYKLVGKLRRENLADVMKITEFFKDLLGNV